MKRIAMVATSLLAVGVLAGALTGVTAAASGPMADAGLDQTVTVGTAVQLDGTGSAHPAGALSSYEWTVRIPDGGEIAPSCRNCSRSQFTPGVVGRYEVRLAVTGSDGERRTDTMYVYVQNAGPDVELDGPRSPEPDSPATYTATAESRNAELAEIAWAVQDEIVAIRPLDGTTDESSLSFSFQGDRTYRVQVVVRDTNGRTAYDQLIVGPGSEDVGAVSWEETESTGGSCDDAEFRSSNPDVCEPEGTPEANGSGSDESASPETEFIYFKSNGYEAADIVGQHMKDSRYLGMQYNEVGLDGGEFAPWNEGELGEAIRRTETKLFGQERRTVECEIVGGRPLQSECGDAVNQLELTGGTSNGKSRSSTGLYAE